MRHSWSILVALVLIVSSVVLAGCAKEDAAAPVEEDLCENIICGSAGTCDLGQCICDSGFELNTTGLCADINECLTDNGGCGDPNHMDCANAPGSFNCVDVDECEVNNGGCTENAVCTNKTGEAPLCTCKPGYLFDPAGLCVPTPACQFVDCSENSHCDAGECVCDNGYSMDSTQKVCADINECTLDNGGCGDALFYACTNTPGASSCADIDECATNNGSCGENATCTNKTGEAPACTCNPGYLFDPAGLCVPTPACQFVDCAGNSHCDAGTCVCDGGFEAGTEDDCTDIDECATENGGCGDATFYTCINEAGTFSCTDIDECATDNGGCGENATCSNQVGAAPGCTCNPGFLFNPDGLCVPIPACQFVACGENSSCSGGVCLCDDGYQEDNTGQCAPISNTWADVIQPLIAMKCATCHLGDRFAFASLSLAGVSFTEEETQKNYQTFLDMVSLDAPKKSRLLAKVLPATDPNAMTHGGGPQIEEGDPTYNALLAWIEEEKAQKCPDCGSTAAKQYLAYVDQPEVFWAIERRPSRSDRPMRHGAKIMMQPLNPETMQPEGEAFAFLPDSFCGADSECDFGYMTVSHDGDRMAFECRLSLEEEDWLKTVRWNICVAEIGADGKAQNPRFLMPKDKQHRGWTVARATPFGLTNDAGQPLKGGYDMHWQTRPRTDFHPAFSPDDQRILFASRGPDPRTGEYGTRTYHGFELLANIISVRVGTDETGASVDGTDARTIYRNEGGFSGFPGFRKNGNVFFNTWNLERIDANLYAQATADGMMEIPVLFGRSQGAFWGKLIEINNGALIAITGMRQGVTRLFTASVGDHTLGTGLDTNQESFKFMDPSLMDEFGAWPSSYCAEPPDGPNCIGSHFTEDAHYFPGGGALVSHNPEDTYYAQGEKMWTKYAKAEPGTWGDVQMQQMLASVVPYLPKKMSIYVMDHHGTLSLLHSNSEGRALRYPVWVGKRQAPRIQPVVTDESLDWADLHIANFPVWLSFRESNSYNGLNKTGHMEMLDTIVKVRVLVKKMGGNACMTDNRPYRFAVNANKHDHPTHLGIGNGTGYTQLVVPVEAGGDGFGDVPLKSDGSVRLRVPAGQLLLFQGVDADGHVRRQHGRLFTMPPGHQVNTSVKREQYQSQCSSCHGMIDKDQEFEPIQTMHKYAPAPMDFDTLAAAEPIVDLTGAQVTTRLLTHLHTIRPLLDTHCTSCHSGEEPAGELSLQAAYSATGNYPKGKWADPDYIYSGYLDHVPEDKRIPSYNFSVSYSWLMLQDHASYKTHPFYLPFIESYTALSDLAPWDAAYQNLMAAKGSSLRYITDSGNVGHMGRGDIPGGNSIRSWLIEILTGKNLSTSKSYEGIDHTTMLTEEQVRIVMAVIDAGYPYMARCDDKLIPSGPNAGKPWGDPKPIDLE